MNIELIIKDQVAVAINSLYGQPVDPAQVQVQLTRSEFEGDQTVMVFPFSENIKKSPEVTGQGDRRISCCQCGRSFEIQCSQGFPKPGDRQ